MSNLIALAAIQIPEGVTVQGIVTDPFTWGWLTIWSILGPIILFTLIGLGAWYAYDFYARTPLESHILKDCFNRKRPLELLEGDSGYLEFEVGAKLGPEGAISTKPKGKDKRWFTGFLPRKSDSLKQVQAPADAPAELKQAAENTNILAKQLSDATVERKMLRGCRVPVHVGYRGKAILTNLKSLAFLSTLEALAKADENFTVHCSLSAIKSLFSQSWNESQVTANEEERELIGFNRARKLNGANSQWIMWLIGIGIFFGGLAAVIAVIKFL